MFGKKAVKAAGYQPTPIDDLRTIIGMVSDDMECVEGVLADLQGIEDLAQELRRKLEA